MTNFGYTRDIPDAPNNPSDDQPDMKINTNNIDTLIDVDHISFNQTNGGLHRQVSMPQLGAIPSGRIVDEGTLYTKADGSKTALFYTPDNSGNEYQLTSTSVSNFSTFGNVTPSGGETKGWTFLPGITGGLIFQYGTIPSTGTTTSIVFPRSFTTLVSVTVTLRSSSRTYGVSSPTTTGFDFVASSGLGSGVDIYWMAIGN